MQVTPRQALLQAADPTYRINKASARAESQAQPMDLLGAEPNKQVTYQTRIAEGLQGPQAAQTSADLEVPGSRINVTA